MNNKRPLADLLRPASLKDYVGQTHLLGESGPIRHLCERQQLCSMILWGPPGCGKTSLVNLLKEYWQLPVLYLSAISSGIKDIKALVSTTENDLFKQQKIVFVDEIHRFNKAQQDAFLPYVENGDIVLIGASTENPAFSINSALLSRMRVFTLRALTKDDLAELMDRALSFLNEQRERTNNSEVAIDEPAKQLLINASGGDARRLLSNIEVALSLLPNSANETGLEQTKIVLSKSIAETACGEQVGSFDKQGDAYYDTLSAFHKSVRGSSVDGSLFWFARLLLASTDIVPICRRLLAIASEDIGNADPKALQVCLNAWDVYHRVGKSEGERAVAQAVIYCALAPKSNAVYAAFTQAKLLAKQHADAPVPFHLRNSTSSITKDLGHGKAYQYAHNYEYAFTPQQTYLPDEVEMTNLYQPSDRGFEKQLAQKIAFLASLTTGTTKS
ncbi:replication-associated recombination protein A [Glaciecola punicea ACAM 611]|uniref:Replication-associated recombination protein A n=1 Tax=Glaciecola punicea ACAM 611 TaxID=1121923 RepID=H5T9R4_9ALTE|nr:replication-associated recombination protein A [Glaciecola punicea]GAB55041.1 replication-associated recombination protein A [Glaciecola punicea ACAM 611]